MIKDKIVCIVGSGPGALSNDPGYVDSHEVVIRVNNYKIMGNTGKRTDVFYSFFGTSVTKKALDLKRDGVQLCIAKCPDDQFIESEWHRQHGAMNGVDFRPIYARRQAWWFCDTYVPTTRDFLKTFEMLGNHVPTTGFSALIDVLSYNPAHVYLTGFDFFTSKIHNLNERWYPASRTNDPICHVPRAEAVWVADNMTRLPISMDKRAQSTLAQLVVKK